MHLVQRTSWCLAIILACFQFALLCVRIHGVIPLARDVRLHLCCPIKQFVNHSGPSNVGIGDVGCVILGAAGGSVRGHFALVVGLIGGVCCSSSSPCSCRLHPPSPPFRDQKMFLYWVFRCQPCHNIHKKTRGAFGRNAKNHNNK